MKQKQSGKLAPHVKRLEEWFGAEQLPLAAAQKRLRALGCKVSLRDLAEWRRAREQADLQRRLLEMIAEAGQQCRAIETEFGRQAPPELETLIKVHRALVLKLSTQANLAPETLKLVTALMKPVMEWARLQEKRREREFAERKYQDQRAAEQSAGAGESVRPATMEKIERELRLFA
jgi:hypothetical protein